MEELKEISTEKLYPHPKNPRKNLGDLSELTGSIKKHGVMQNLTVYPDGDGFRVLIGHRRLAAAKKAGIKAVPCRVIDPPEEKDQIAIMLSENMQRNDLTVMEQAESFQMILDLGGSVKDIAMRSGFSESTIYHRLNIAKLDKKTLKRAMKNEEFQLSINDFIALEAVESIEERNRILSVANSSSDLRWKAKNAAMNEARAKNEKAIIKLMSEAGIPRLPKNKEDQRWSLTYETIDKFDLNLTPKTIRYKYDPKKDKDIFFMKDYGYIKIILLSKKQKEEKSAEEIKRKEQERRRKEIQKTIRDEIREFIITQPIPEGTAVENRNLFRDLIRYSYVYGWSTHVEYINNTRGYTNEDAEKIWDKMSDMPFKKLLFITEAIDATYGSFDYDHQLKKVLKLIEKLSGYGFSLTDRDGVTADDMEAFLKR